MGPVMIIGSGRSGLRLRNGGGGGSTSRLFVGSTARPFAVSTARLFAGADARTLSRDFVVVEFLFASLLTAGRDFTATPAGLRRLAADDFLDDEDELRFATCVQPFSVDRFFTARC